MGDTNSKTIRKRKVRHRFFVPGSRLQSSAGGMITIVDQNTVHHLRDVLRLNAGALVGIFDNSDKEYEAEVLECKPSLIKFQVIRATAPRVESPLRVTLGQALLKGNSFDHALTLAAELGCARIAPMFTSRTVVKLSKVEAADRTGRWEKILQEASAQCGRVKVPLLEMPGEFKDFLARKNEGLKIILWEKGGSGQLRQILEEAEPNSNLTLLAGPEGGFEQMEVKEAVEAGFQVWGLGPRILRAENAAAIALSILQFVRGDMG
jgi:16S rRNA (uracil1498-N3)-methyltransferase